MNVAMFTNAYTPIVGGVERSIETFSEDMRQLGHATLVVTVAVPGTWDSTDLIFRLPGITEIAGTQFSLRLPVPAGLRARLDRFEPDVVHSHHPFMLGDTALRVARRRELPLVFTHHTMYERYAYLFSEESAALQRVCRAIATEYANLCDLVIAPTFSIRDVIRDRGVESDIEVIPTGIDVDFYRRGDGGACREQHGIPADAFLLGYVGRVVKVKNMEFLARAAARFLQVCESAWYLVVGDGESQQRVRSILEDAGVSERVVMTGALQGAELAGAYAAMDLFGFASTTDTQGIVLVESFAAGTPVVALQAPGAVDTIEDGKTGRLLGADTDEDGFAQALCEACRHPDRVAEWSECAAKAAEHYDRRRCAKRLLDCYESLCAANGKEAGEPSDFLDAIQERFAAEWDLLREKFAVAGQALQDDTSA